jgi:hypothetical protein
MANGAFKFKDNSGNVVSFISGSGSNISFSGGTLDLSGMTGLTLGNLTLSGTTQNAISASHAASYLLTSSFNTYSGTTDTVIGTLQTSTSSLNSFTSSATSRLSSIETSTGSLNTFSSSTTTRLNSIEGVSGSYATTGSNQFKNDQVITGSLTVTGFIDAQELRTTYISSSILYRSGSTKFGDELSDTHAFTGSMVISGSVSTTGNVGIGTASPGFQLTLNKNDNNYLQIRSSDAGAAGIYFGRQNDSVRGGIYYDNNADALYFQTFNLTTNTVITSAGNVGIGTASPSGKLHLSSTGDTYLVMTGGASPRTYSWLVDATNLRLFSGVGDTTLLTIASTGAATFSSSVTASGSKSQFVANGGNSAGAGISLNTTLTTSPTLRRNWGIFTEDQIEGDFAIKCSTSAGGEAGVGNTRLAILSNGNVGISTTNPVKTLEVRGTLAISNSSSSYWYIDRDDSDGRFKILTDTDNERLSITTEGYLGTTVTSTTISSGDLLGVLSFISKDTSTYSSGGITNIRSYATSTYNTGNVAGDLRFYVSNGLQNITGTYLFGTEAMRINSDGVVRITNLTSNGLVGTDSSGNLRIVNSEYTEIATGTITYSMNSGSPWGINNSFPGTIRNYEDEGMAGSAGVATSSNLGRGVTFDLGSAKAVRKIVERGYSTKNLNQIIAQYSTDNSNWTDIYVYNHVYGNTQKDMEFNPTGAISARYWRWFIHSWTEREVQNYYTYESIIYT